MAAPGVTEEEAALYDRQIRLWGLEAQNKMRSAHVVLVGFSSVATEIVKNIVLAGVGAVTIVDAGAVREEDLGAGFFFRADDVGKPRVSDAPLERIRQLNTLVRVEGRGALDVLEDFASLKADALVATTGTRTEWTAWNDRCRACSMLFYGAVAQGWGGVLFSDLLEHHYVVQRAVPGLTEREAVRYTQTYVPLADSLRVSWKTPLAPGDVRGRPVRTWHPQLWATWALWDWAEADHDPAPTVEALAAALETRTLALLTAKGVDPTRVFDRARTDRARFFAGFAAAVHPGITHGSLAAMAPTSAVLGGLVAQDLLNALGHREEPIVNWMVLDTAAGTSPHSPGIAPIYAIGTDPAQRS